MSDQIKIYGSNNSKKAKYSVTSKGVYECANAQLTRGATGTPASLSECFKKFPEIEVLAKSLGFLQQVGEEEGPIPEGQQGPGAPIPVYGYTLWTGAKPIEFAEFPTSEDLEKDTLFDDMSYEGQLVKGPTYENFLGEDWLGCLWGSPHAPYSTTCPDIRPNYEAYLKLRLNDATFWNTPKQTPVNRAEFLEAFKSSKKSMVTVAGDFNLKIGQLVYLNVNNASGYPYNNTNSFLTGYYYIIGVKHVLSLGTHETSLTLSQIADLTSVYV
jgi:hypothetical protein